VKSLAVNRKRTNNIIVTNKRTKRHAMIYKTLQLKQKTKYRTAGTSLKTGGGMG
jgi:hypothetical protein